MRSRDGNDETVSIECDLVWVSHAGTSIGIEDGSEEPDPLDRKGKRKIRRRVFLPCSQIDDGDFDPHRYKLPARINIEIPNWLALREGLI